MREILLTLIYVFTCSANAALINNNLYTTDTTTNLDWLDLTATLGMTSSEVRSQLLPTWDIDTDSWVESQFMGGGWSFATESQATDLVTRNIGESFGLYEIGSQSSNNAYALMNLLGLTYVSPSIFIADFTAGIYVNNNYRLDLITISNTINFCNGVTCDMKASNSKVEYGWDITGGSSVGKFLVRENISSVPLPASFMLFISGLGLLFSRKLRKCSSNRLPKVSRFLQKTQKVAPLSSAADEGVRFSGKVAW